MLFLTIDCPLSNVFVCKPTFWNTGSIMALTGCHSAFIKCAIKLCVLNVAACCFVSLPLVLASEWARRVRSISLQRAHAAPTFPPVHERRVHRVYTDTADSCVTPPNSHAPSLHQSALDHVLITRCLHVHWSVSATPLFLIGNMLPPARLLWILFLFFFFFLRSWFTQLRLDLAVKKWLHLWARGLLSVWVALCVSSHCCLQGVLLRMPTFASDQVSWFLFFVLVCFLTDKRLTAPLPLYPFCAMTQRRRHELKHLYATKLHVCLLVFFNNLVYVWSLCVLF